MVLSEYLQQNNLPDFLTTWEEVSELTGIELSELPHNRTNGKKTEAVKVQVIEVSKPKQTDNNDLAAIIANAINPLLTRPQTSEIDENKVIALIKQHAPVKHIEVISPQAVSRVEGLQHCEFEKVVKMMGAGLNLYLYGPAGTGKTQLAENAAIALGKRFAFISVCAQSTKSDLLGFMNANGNYISTLFRDIYENGGVFLIDEIDNGNPNVLAVLNSTLANGFCAFPDGMIKKHESFLCIAAANTFGTGADRQYVGRNQLDAATLNRFVQVAINYDQSLEIALFGPIATKIQTIRQKLTNERVIISMRNISNAAKLVAVGFTESEAIELAVINTIPENLQKLAK